MIKKIRSRTGEFKYDVCLSFAGDDRRYVEKVADQLRMAGVRVFYDRYEQVELWGKDLYAHLSDIYSTAARYCVLFVSASYARRVWTNHERAAAQERALREHGEYVLPARFDDTSIPGLRRTVGYVNLKGIKPTELAEMIAEKLGAQQRTAYLPPMPDLLLRSYVKDYGPAIQYSSTKQRSTSWNHFAAQTWRNARPSSDCFSIPALPTYPTTFT